MTQPGDKLPIVQDEAGWKRRECPILFPSRQAAETLVRWLRPRVTSETLQLNTVLESRRTTGWNQIAYRTEAGE